MKKKSSDFNNFGDFKGFINTSGDIIVPAVYSEEYSMYGDFKEGLSVVKKNYLYGYINKAGKEVIAIDYLLTTAFDKGAASVKDKDSIYWVIDARGQKKSEGYKEMTNFSNGIALATRKNGQRGFVDTKGVFKEIPGYELYYFFTFNCTDGVLVVKKDSRYGLMDMQGKLIVPIIYKEITAFNEGLIAANLNGKKVDSGTMAEHFENGWGFLNSKGQTTVQHQFKNILYFSDGLAAAEEGGKWGYIDTKGNWVIKPLFDSFQGQFVDGLARVEIKTSDNYGAPVKYGYIDKTGKYVWEPQM